MDILNCLLGLPNDVASFLLYKKNHGGENIYTFEGYLEFLAYCQSNSIDVTNSNYNKARNFLANNRTPILAKIETLGIDLSGYNCFILNYLGDTSSAQVYAYKDISYSCSSNGTINFPKADAKILTFYSSSYNYKIETRETQSSKSAVTFAIAPTEPTNRKLLHS